MEVMPSPQARRMAEFHVMMADTKSDYYRGPMAPILQAEYRNLLRGQDQADTRQRADLPQQPDILDNLGITEQERPHILGRVQQISDELGGDMSGIDMAFEGLSDTLQRVCYQALARPADRPRLIRSLSPEDRADLEYFIEEAITDEEHDAIARALGLL